MRKNVIVIVGGIAVTIFGCISLAIVATAFSGVQSGTTSSAWAGFLSLITLSMMCGGVLIVIIGVSMSFLQNRKTNKPQTKTDSSIIASSTSDNIGAGNSVIKSSSAPSSVSLQQHKSETKASFMDIFKINEIRAELIRTTTERDSLKSALADTDKMEYHQLKQAIENLGSQKEKALQEAQTIQAEFAKRKQDFDQQLSELGKEIELKKEEIIILDDEKSLQSFGFYKPRYDLQNSEMYKVKLEQIRDQQEQYVKSGKATILPTNFTFNNSRTEGDKVIKEYAKLILRSFNNECDASIINVKFNNVYVIKKKIQKAFDTLNNLGKRMSISIVQTYLSLKLEELSLCYEYQVKKQEEKEEQKLIKEQMREEAKRMKEIEDMKAKIEKEEKHFGTALKDVNIRLGQAQSENERNLLEKEREAITQKMIALEKDKLDVYNQEQNTRAGYVYIISNIGAFGENIYKIGVTRRLDPEDRVDELGSASVPFDFDIHAMIFSDDAPALENALHKAFEKKRLNMINRRREFFNVSLDDIEKVVKTNFNKPVEFTKVADAAQYRESLMLKASVASQ